MASGYTPYLGLCQWSPQDKFLREEFNGDNEKIDGMVKELVQADQALGLRSGVLGDGLARAEYHLYQLMLQNEYDGKYTGFCKAVLFDGFCNGDGLAALPAGVVRTESPPALKLYAKGVGDRVQSYGTSSWVVLGQMSDSWTPAGCGRATGIKLRVSCADTAQFRITLTCGGASATVSGTVTGNWAQEQVFTFPTPVLLKGGETCSLSVTNTGSTSLHVYTSSNGYLGYHLLCSPVAVPTAVVTAVARSTGVTGAQALAWVRYVGGGVGVRLNGKAMVPTGQRQTMTLRGQSCTEGAFVLEEPVGDAVTVGLHLDAKGGEGVTVYDYGVVVM